MAAGNSKAETAKMKPSRVDKQPSTSAARDRARQFIDDVLRINAKYGMRSVRAKGGLDAAIAEATRQAQQFGSQ